jgi:hypothetical protein
VSQEQEQLSALRYWLDTLDKLRQFVEPTDPKRKAFNDAWEKAYGLAVGAAVAWVEETKGDEG